jgi:hypothetical protein
VLDETRRENSPSLAAFIDTIFCPMVRAASSTSRDSTTRGQFLHLAAGAAALSALVRIASSSTLRGRMPRRGDKAKKPKEGKG